MATLPVRSMPQPWRLLYWRAGIFFLIGLALIFPQNDHPGLVVPLLSMLLIVLGLTAIRFGMSSRNEGRTATWFLVAGLLDVGFGLILVLYRANPTEGINLLFGAWGLLVGFIQAVEGIYGFLGIQESPSILPKGYFLTVIHLVNVLIGGGMAFILLQQPLGTNSYRFAGLFPMAFSIVLLILTRRLQIDERVGQPKN